MSATAEPHFGHPHDLLVRRDNVNAGRPLCERCDGGGNELFAMYRKCSACGGNGVDPNWSPPEPSPPPRAWELSSTGGVSCPQSWPEWAVTEDGDWVWVRADLEARASDVAAEALTGDEGLILERRGRVAMALELEDTDWAEDWLLVAVALEADPQDAVVYVKYEVVYADDAAPLPSKETRG